MQYTVKSDFLSEEAKVVVNNGRVMVDEHEMLDFRVDEREPSLIYARLNGTEVPIYVNISDSNTVQLSLRGYGYSVDVFTERDLYFQSLLKATSAGSAGKTRLKTPMPGLLKTVAVSEGQHVKKGQLLFVLEAMKMENDIKAPHEGTVADIAVKEGNAVEKNQPLCAINAGSE